MQLFTVEMLIEMRLQARELAKALLESVFDAAWQSVARSFSDLARAIQVHERDAAMVAGLFIISAIVLLYCLLKLGLLRSIDL